MPARGVVPNTNIPGTGLQDDAGMTAQFLLRTAHLCRGDIEQAHGGVVSVGQCWIVFDSVDSFGQCWTVLDFG